MNIFFKGEGPQCHFVNVELTNNIIVGAVSPIRFLNVSIGTLKVENNLYYNCGSTTPYFYNATPDTYVNQDNIISNPLMVGGNPYNFALLSSSPAIDRGKTITRISLTVDYDGVGIPIGSAPDIGAYEYGVPSPAIDPTVSQQPALTGHPRPQQLQEDTSQMTVEAR